MKSGTSFSKIKILPILALVFYFFLVLSTFVSGIDDFQLGFAEGTENAKSASNKMTYYVSIKPRNGVLSFPDTVMNLKTNSAVSFKYDNVALIKADKNAVHDRLVIKYQVLSNIMMLLIFVLVILFPIYFVKIMFSMKNGVVFEKKNIRWVRRIGEFLLMYYLFNYIFDWSQYKINNTLFEFNEYVVEKASTDLIWLLLGIIVLLFAEILTKGTILKEEQDLTI